ncbi:unnamed protein product, partial [Rotaria magnacalcarata]
SSPIPTTTSISKTVVNENPSEQIDDDDQTAATNNLDQESEEEVQSQQQLRQRADSTAV